MPSPTLGRSQLRASSNTEPQTDAPALVGEDAAAFALEQQSTTSWALFFGLLTGVLGMLYLVRNQFMQLEHRVNADC